jgi:hypothetical protein
METHAAVIGISTLGTGLTTDPQRVPQISEKPQTQGLIIGPLESGTTTGQ